MELILYNGDIRTMDEKCKKVSAIAIDRGLIVKTGADNDILALKTDKTKLVDLGGRLAIPGFNDSHMHLIGYASELESVNLTGTKSADEIVNRLKAHIENNNISNGTPVFGHGWNQNFFENKKYPDRYDIDKVSTVHPIVISRACHHVNALNSYALNLFGIGKDTEDIEDGEIIRDINGEPTGVLTENARKLAAFDESLTIEAIEKLIGSALSNLSKMGITSVQTDDFTADTPYNMVYEAYCNMAKDRRLTVRVNQQCRASGYSGYLDIVNMPDTNEEIRPYYKLGPIKVMADGSLGARTALMLDDYNDDPGNKGIPIYTKEELDDIVELAHISKRQVAIHAIGDGAMDMALNAIEKALKKEPKDDARHGIVHCQITDADMLRRFKQNNILAFIQPIFIHADWAIVESRVGKEKAATSYAFKTLTDMGVYTPFGTDCPVEEFDPFKNIYCAVTRKDLDGNPEEGYNPSEAMSMEEALRCYTAKGAYASFEENVKGMIKEGMYADIAVLEQNLFDMPAHMIPSTEVKMTIFDGKIIYEK